MKKLILFAMILGFFWITDGKVFAATLNVPSTEYPTIQAAIDAANAGDTVEVSAGTYHENITMKSGVVIQGAGPGDDPSNNSIIDGGGTGSVVTAIGVDSEAKLDGFKITNGSGGGYGGGGMYNRNSSPMVSNCIFSGNSSNLHGGGMANYSSSPTVINCIFLGNTASIHGGGIFNNLSTPTVINCTFMDNEAGGGGGGIRNDASSMTVTNCTFSANLAGIDGGISNWGGGSPTAINCILWGDTPGEIGNTSSSMVVTYSNIQGGYTGTGNINADPLFVNPGAGDFHLRQGSPCIDAGDNSALYIPANDYDGDDRIIDGNRDGTATVDMGIDEYNPSKGMPWLMFLLE